MDSYRTLANMVTARVEEKKSVFIAVAAPASNEQMVDALLGSLRSQHRAANHHVYAYLLRETGCARCSDDGEPSQTAGMPVLGVLQHAGITDCALVVIRYFGGTLLGVGGLVRAYTAAAQAALKKKQTEVLNL